MFLQGDHQRKFGRDEVYEFYTNGVAIGEMFSTTVHGITINLHVVDLAQILSIPSGGWGHYVKVTWLSLYNLPSALDISRMFSGNPHLVTYHRVLKHEMTPLHQFYFMWFTK